MDTLTREQRTQRMSLIRSRGTKPEKLVEEILNSLRFSYDSHVSGLPGTPDFVFRRKRKVIFVHGCFWHRHAACRNGQRMPKSKLDFWEDKLHKNKKRDTRKLRQLNRLGWSYQVIWECQLKHREKLRDRLRRYLSGENH